MTVDTKKGPKYHSQSGGASCRTRNQQGGFRVVKGPKYHNQSNNVNTQSGGFRVVKGPKYHNQSNNVNTQSGGFRVVKGPKYHNQANNVNTQLGGASSQWGNFLPVSQGVVHKDNCLMMGPNLYPRHTNQKGGKLSSKRKTKGKRRTKRRRTQKRKS